MLTLLLLLLSSLNLSSTIPLVATLSSESNTVSYGTEIPTSADVRSTQDIVWSCLATIFACTWIAVHPNLPGPWDSEWTMLKRRVTIMIYAMLAPEFMTMWAMLQWMAARKIASEFNIKYHKEQMYNGSTQHEVEDMWTTIKSTVNEWFKGPDSNRRRDYRWTSTHGFFIQMGGFVLSTDDQLERVLTLNDLQELIKKGEVDVPRITEHEINDRSKGDFLTKALVVLQTTWFVLQCAARWASNLPVTELEVVTLAFATLNVFTYGLWWKKPQNVQFAVSIPWKHTPNDKSQRAHKTHGDGRGSDRTGGSLRERARRNAKDRLWRMMDERKEEMVFVISRAVVMTDRMARAVAEEMTLREVIRELAAGETVVGEMKKEMEMEMGREAATDAAKEIAGEMTREMAREMVDNTERERETEWVRKRVIVDEWENDIKGERIRDKDIEWETLEQWEWDREMELEMLRDKMRQRDIARADSIRGKEEERVREWERLKAKMDTWRVERESIIERAAGSEWQWSQEMGGIVNHMLGEVIEESKVREIDITMGRVWETGGTSKDIHKSWVWRHLGEAMRLGWRGWFQVPWILLWAFLRPLSKMSGFTHNVLGSQSLRIPMFWKEQTDSRVDFPVLAIGVLFGTLHLIPWWSGSFLSTTELWLWRSSALMITVEPMVVFALRLTDTLRRRRAGWLPQALFATLTIPAVMGIPLYIIARLALLTLAFVTLRGLPVAAFADINWTTFLPHI